MANVVVQSYTKSETLMPSGTDFAIPYDAVYVGGAGDLTYTAVGSSTPVTLVGIPAASWLRIAIKNVAVSSTCTAMVGHRY